MSTDIKNKASDYSSYTEYAQEICRRAKDCGAKNICLNVIKNSWDAADDVGYAVRQVLLYKGLYR